MDTKLEMTGTMRFICLLSAFCVQLGATSIALIVTPSFVVVAADSRSVDAQGRMLADVCKIRKAGSVFYVPNNFVDDTVTGYSLDRTVIDAHGTSVVDVAYKVRTAILPSRIAALERSRRSNPAGFKKSFASGQAMGVAFVGFDNNTPSVVDLRFVIVDLGAAKLEVRAEENQCPGVGCPDGYAMVLIPADLTAEFQAAHPFYWKGGYKTVAASAQAFLDLAIGKKRADIGAPVSLLLVDSRQGTWLKPGICGK